MSYFVVCYLYVSFSGLITSFGGRESCFFLLSITRNNAPRCLGYAASFYCGTPWAVFIIVSYSRVS